MSSVYGQRSTQTEFAENQIYPTVFKKHTTQSRISTEVEVNSKNASFDGHQDNQVEDTNHSKRAKFGKDDWCSDQRQW